MGNLLTDKYSEGHPYHRFYAGCENVDAIEQEAVDSAKALFGADHAYVQPHSGADANLFAFFSILMQKVQAKEIENLGKKNLDELSAQEYESIRKLFLNQKIMGLSLSSGGHLTHGYKHNFSGKLFHSIQYEVDPKTHLLNYDHIREVAKKEKPLILLAGYSAYPRYIDFALMRQIADEVGATFVVDMAHFAGLVAGKAFVGNYNPIAFAHIVTSTTHKTLRGPRGGLVLCTSEFTDTINKGCPLVLGGPLPHVIAAKAIAFQEASTPSFESYAKKIIENAQILAQEFQNLGFKVVTGGTDNHLLLLDISPLGLTGRQGELALRQAHMTANRNMVPFDSNGPWYTSGIRLGTPAITTLGMGEAEVRHIARLIAKVLKNVQPEAGNKARFALDKNILEEAKKEVAELLQRFPLYPELII
jgi:glycine hydroxymethyltransferase